MAPSSVQGTGWNRGPHGSLNWLEDEPGKHLKSKLKFPLLQQGGETVYAFRYPVVHHQYHQWSRSRNSLYRPATSRNRSAEP